MIDKLSTAFASPAMVYATLAANELPRSGVYRGSVLSGRWWVPVWLARLAWGGKVFEGTTVINRLGGHLMIRGKVSLDGADVVIWYPQLRLEDRIRPYDGGIWLGKLLVNGRPAAWFTLEIEK